MKAGVSLLPLRLGGSVHWRKGDRRDDEKRGKFLMKKVHVGGD